MDSKELLRYQVFILCPLVYRNQLAKFHCVYSGSVHSNRWLKLLRNVN
jgi:hypothetical protein